MYRRFSIKSNNTTLQIFVPDLDQVLMLQQVNWKKV
jgi:hypothetical protein